jgi:hypothetical protein
MLPAIFDIRVAFNSDIGFVWGLTRSCQNKADKLLRPDDNVLKYVVFDKDSESRIKNLYFL